MPNHVINILTFDGEEKEIANLRKSIRSKDKIIDFQKIHPIKQSEGLYFESEEELKYTIANWGTKWNAYNQHETEDKIIFTTAYVAVPELMIELSSQFPEVHLSYIGLDVEGDNPYQHWLLRDGTIANYYESPLALSDCYKKKTLMEIGQEVPLGFVEVPSENFGIDKDNLEDISIKPLDNNTDFRKFK